MSNFASAYPPLSLWKYNVASLASANFKLFVALYTDHPLGTNFILATEFLMLMLVILFCYVFLNEFVINHKSVLTVQAC